MGHGQFAFDEGTAALPFAGGHVLQRGQDGFALRGVRCPFAEGRATGRRIEPSERGPNRKVYSLTDEGREGLLAWLGSGPAMGAERFAYLAQLYFMDALGDLQETRAFMGALKQRLQEWLGRLEAIEAAVTAGHGSAPEYYSDGGFHQFATLRMGIFSIGSKVAWCDETLAAIDRRIALPAGVEAAAHCRAARGAAPSAADGCGSGTLPVGTRSERKWTRHYRRRFSRG